MADDDAPLCPHCGLASCYHCWACGADLIAEDHAPGCPDDPNAACRRCTHRKGDHYDYHGEPSYCHGGGPCDCEAFQ